MYHLLFFSRAARKPAQNNGGGPLPYKGWELLRISYVAITNKLHEAMSLLRKQQLLAQTVNVHNNAHKNLRTVPTLHQTNPVQTIPRHL